MTVGTYAEAAIIAQYGNAHDNGYDLNGEPDGFERIGSGCYRTAFKSTVTGTVYKFPRGDSAQRQNYAEAFNARYLRTLTIRGVYFPETDVYTIDGTPIVAQENANDFLDACVTDRSVNADWDRVHALGLSDTHGGNYAQGYDGTVIPFDLGISSGSSDCGELDTPFDANANDVWTVTVMFYGNRWSDEYPYDSIGDGWTYTTFTVRGKARAMSLADAYNYDGKRTVVMQPVDNSTL